uniref:Uncharacterized protein n=1 Tax=Prolemur simus TaxID=1328070 RepID=A0A8C8ZYH9_PROSS
MQLTRRKLLHLCCRGVAGGEARRWSALQPGGRGRLGDCTVPGVPRLAGRRARRGRRPTWGRAPGRGCLGALGRAPRPWSPRSPPSGLVRRVQRTDRGGSGVCRALSAFRSLAGSLCKPSGVGRTAGGAAGPGSPGSGRILAGSGISSQLYL